MPPHSVRTVEKKTFVRTIHGDEVDFPFQQHIHQLPRDQYEACLRDLENAEGGVDSFKAMLRSRYGQSMCDLFLVPYNEKLYATDLNSLDVDAMGRFFPHASAEDIKARKQVASYNATFTYPNGGAIEYINALLKDAGPVSLSEGLVSIDLAKKIATTTKREIQFEHLVTSAPLPKTLALSGVGHDASAFTCNQVLVFNLGFDKKGRDDAHWLYFADPSLSFYRVGFYDNILGSDRMSLYVEIGMKAGEPVDVEASRARVLTDLQHVGIVTHHQLVASHHVVMNPAYVHITKRSIEETARTRALLAKHGVHSVGRYGGWTYCSIEDNLVETRQLARNM
jgi:protoporphyrinogen oxidase